jgi:hypothetical protein
MQPLTVTNQEIGREFMSVEGFPSCETISTEDNKGNGVDKENHSQHSIQVLEVSNLVGDGPCVVRVPRVAQQLSETEV